MEKDLGAYKEVVENIIDAADDHYDKVTDKIIEKVNK